MSTRHYEKPETDVIPMSFQEDVCITPSGRLPNYNVVDGFEWEEEED